MTKEGRTGYAIIGCGVISKFHVSAIRRIPEAELVGVCGFEPQESRSGAERFDTKPYLSREEIWKDNEVDAVCICTPSGLHGEIALEAVKNGKHVLIEKPMAMTLAECDNIIQTAKEQNVLVGVVSQLRYSPAIRYVKQVMDEGGLGGLIGADLYMKYYRSQEYYDSSPWRGTRSMDGGALMNQGIHGVDLLRYLAGPMKGIYAKSATKLHRMEAEDILCAVTEFENGALGVIQASTCACPGFPRRLELSGERGTIILEEDRIALWNVEGVAAPKFEDGVRKGDYGKNDPSNIDEEGHYRQLSNFTAAILGKERLLNDGVEGRKTMEIILGAYESAQTGKPVAFSMKADD